jgi:hypothetical protein
MPNKEIIWFVQGIIDGLKVTKNGKGSTHAMLLGDAGTWDERGRDVEELETRVLNSQRSRDD